MFNRALATKLKQLATQYPIVSVSGPRQSGKTTLTKLVFPDYHYVSLLTMKSHSRRPQSVHVGGGEIRKAVVLEFHRLLSINVNNFYHYCSLESSIPTFGQGEGGVPCENMDGKTTRVDNDRAGLTTPRTP